MYYKELMNFSNERKKALQKLRKEMKTGKDLLFQQINPVKEETVEFLHQNSILVIVMFVSKASANAFLPESPILL